MTLLTNPIITPANVPQLIGVLKVGCGTARGAIDVLAALLSAPPPRGEIAGLCSPCGTDRTVPNRAALQL